MDASLAKYLTGNPKQDTIKQLKRRKILAEREWYSCRSLLGNDWAMLYFLLGGREAGKSYNVTNFFCAQWRLYGRPFTWLRLSEESKCKLLNNNAEKLIDPDLRRKYNLDIVTNGDNVYEVTKRSAPNEKTGKTKILEKKLMCRVLALSTFYNDKGSGLFDKDFLNDPNMYYNIALDEMNKEKNEKRTQDIVYSLANELENLIRSTKNRVRIICIGNTLEEASDILAGIGFIPQKFGRFYLKSKRTVVEYIEPSEVYKARRKGTVADILAGNESTFTNKIESDISLLTKTKLITPMSVIKFTKSPSSWYTVWNNNIIAQYNGEKKKPVAMRPYLDEQFDSKLRDNIISIFDARAFKFHNLITYQKFKKEMQLLKPRG